MTLKLKQKEGKEQGGKKRRNSLATTGGDYWSRGFILGGQEETVTLTLRKEWRLISR